MNFHRLMANGRGGGGWQLFKKKKRSLIRTHSAFTYRYLTWKFGQVYWVLRSYLYVMHQDLLNLGLLWIGYLKYDIIHKLFILCKKELISVSKSPGLDKFLLSQNGQFEAYIHFIKEWCWKELFVKTRLKVL